MLASFTVSSESFDALFGELDYQIYLQECEAEFKMLVHDLLSRSWRYFETSLQSSRDGLRCNILRVDFEILGDKSCLSCSCLHFP